RITPTVPRQTQNTIKATLTNTFNPNILATQNGNFNEVLPPPLNTNPNIKLFTITSLACTA
ncbi:hypothetical protein ACLBSN_31550, partial [Klebsiella pneumoniae]